MPITLTSSDATKVYDGTPLTNDEVTITGDLPKGVKFSFDVTGSQTLPGESENTFTYTVSREKNFLSRILNLNNAEEDSEADNYDVKVVYGTLKVTNRGEDPDDPNGAKYKAEFTAKSGEFTYDAKAHKVEGFTTELTYTNDKGVKFTVEGITAVLEKTDAGEYEVKVTGTPVVKDAEGNDVTAQFDVTAKSGKLVINRAEVTVTANDFTKNVGDADPEFDATVEGLFGDDKVSFSIKREEGEEVGEYALTPEGAEVQGNYTVKFVEGTLTIVNKVPDTSDRTGIGMWYATMGMSFVCFLAVLLELKRRKLLA